MENILGPYVLGTTDDEHQGIYTGDALELAEAIPDESVDFIFTDPVYWHIDDYLWLAEVASRVLKPTGTVLAQVGALFWIEAQNAFREVGEMVHLPPIIEVYHFSTTAFQVGSVRILSGYQPYIWAIKTMRTLSIMNRSFGKRDKVHHEWGDGANFFSRYIQVLTESDQVIFDPFTGGGTVPAVCKMLGRKWLAFEINPAVAERAQERVRNTPSPLFTAEVYTLPLMAV